MATGEILDPAAIAELRRAQDVYGNPSFIRQLVAIFEANTPGKLDRIRHALVVRDAAAIEQVAHALKTNCGMLGAVRMAEACGRMEEAASRADLAGASAAFGEVEAQLPAVLSALSAIE